MTAVLFWGGWLPPVDWAPLYYVPGIIWFFAKILFFFFVFSWVKATVPRFRYDQLMRLGWKIFLPISLLWVFLVSGWLMLTRYQNTDQASVPDRAHLAQLRTKGATDVCYADIGGKLPGAAPVFVKRDAGSLGLGKTVSLLDPADYRGGILIEKHHSGGFGGSAMGRGLHGEIGFSYTDVLYNGRPSLMLWMPDRQGVVRMWNCQSEYELERLQA
jgi:hypothetical protein